MNRMETDLSPDPGRRQARLVERMFTTISPTYDRLNHVLSCNVDRWWRKAAIKEMAPEEGHTYLDICTGTGDLAFSLLKRVDARVIGLDFSNGMLELAKEKGAGTEKYPLVRGDSLSLPFKNGSVDGVMVSFGVRNFEDLSEGIKEAARVIKENGVLMILELSKPDGRVHNMLYGFYFKTILPVIGRIISGNGEAYRYLPGSVDAFAADAELHDIMRQHGLQVFRYKPLTGGIAAIHCAVKRD